MLISSVYKHPRSLVSDLLRLLSCLVRGRQTLPLMRVEPLPIPVRSDVRPTAVHTSVPVPLQWEAKVHRDLMRDVALGVIEPVPVNTPVTWCSRMVVVPKHNGEPNRTVDMQALNRVSISSCQEVVKCQECRVSHQSFSSVKWI